MKSRSFFVSSLTIAGLCVLMGGGCRNGAPSPSMRVDPQVSLRASDAATCSHEYLPLRLGYRIHYRTTYPATMATSGEGVYSMEVVRVTEQTASLKTTTESSQGAPISSEVEYRCIDGGLFASGYANIGGLSPGGSAETIEAHTTQAEGAFLPAQMTIGSKWQGNFTIVVTTSTGSSETVLGKYSETGSVTVARSMRVGITRTAIGMERVRVAAGEFDAMKIGTVMMVESREALWGTEWWVKDVGMVKSIIAPSTVPGEGSITTEATGYYVPASGTVRSEG